MAQPTTIEDLLKAGMTSTSLGSAPANPSAELNPQQAEVFVRRIFEATPMLTASRRVTMTTRSMNIDKIGIQRRLLRGRAEGVAPTINQPINFGQVVLNAKPLTLPIEISAETLLFNIERGGLEDTILSLITLQTAQDLNELGWSGQKTSLVASTANAVANANLAGTPGANTVTVDATAAFPYKGTLVVSGTNERINYDAKDATHFYNCSRAQDGTAFATYGAVVVTLAITNTTLSTMDGWLYKIRNGGGNVFDHAAYDAGDGAGFIGAKSFKQMILNLPPAYLAAFGPQLRFIMHPLQHMAWNDWLVRNRTLAMGDAALAGNALASPYGYPIMDDPTMPLNCVVFTPPANCITAIVAGNDITISRDTTSKDVISRKVRYYQLDMYGDLAVERTDAAVVCDNLKNPLLLA